MSELIDENLRNKINEEKTIKVIATEGKDNVLHVVFKSSIHAREDGLLEFYELIESSQNNKNLVYSIWHDKEVKISILTKNKESYEIGGTVKRAIVAGAEFEKAYQKVIEDGYKDLSTVWLITPKTIKDTSLIKRADEEEKLHPVFTHLDRLAK